MTATAKIYPSAWNRWRLAANASFSDNADRLQRVSEFFCNAGPFGGCSKDSVFGASGIDSSELKNLSIATIPAGTAIQQFMPSDIRPINGKVEMIDVKFWAPATAKSVPWPENEVDTSSSASSFFTHLLEESRIILYQIFAPIVTDKSRIVQVPKTDMVPGSPTYGKQIKITTYMDPVLTPSEQEARAEKEGTVDPLAAGFTAVRNTAYVLGGGFLVYKVIDLFASKRKTP